MFLSKRIRSAILHHRQNQRLITCQRSEEERDAELFSSPPHTGFEFDHSNFPEAASFVQHETIRFRHFVVAQHRPAKKQEFPCTEIVQVECPVSRGEVDHALILDSKQMDSIEQQAEEQRSMQSRYSSELKEFAEQRAQRRREYQANKALQAQLAELAEFWEQRAQARREYRAGKNLREGGVGGKSAQQAASQQHDCHGSHRGTSRRTPGR